MIRCIESPIQRLVANDGSCLPVFLDRLQINFNQECQANHLLETDGIYMAARYTNRNGISKLLGMSCVFLYQVKECDAGSGGRESVAKAGRDSDALNASCDLSI